MSNDLVEVGETTPTTSSSFDLVDVESAKEFMDNYQAVCKALLDSSDFQKITIMGKPTAFKKKSAWRKIATAFNISDDIEKKEVIRDENYQIISATFVVRATAPNGRYGMGTASCSIFDKIKAKDKEMPSNFELRKRFNNAENDVIGTAHTRAKSRAISDLVGMGEVSAEEMMEMGVIDKPKSVSAKPKTTEEPVGKTKAKTAAKSKPKTTPKPKTTAKPKAKPKDAAIEVEVVEEVSSKKPSMSVKEMMEKDKNIKRAVNELRDENRTVNLDSIKSRLLNYVQYGSVPEKEYLKAKELLE